MFFKILSGIALTVMLAFPSMILCAQNASGVTVNSQGYAGSESCKRCHEKFYGLWSTSRHGLAMQPFTATFAKAQLTPQENELLIGNVKYIIDLTQGFVSETGQGGTKQYPIKHVLGGKNVYYFLTPFPNGRLQTLPIAYDVNKKAWFDTAASGVRHFPGASRDQSVTWKDPGYTFNTSCHNCHVSQLSNDYDLKTDTYKTTWTEPGINCETCHGPSAEHNRVMIETPQGQQPQDMKIISVKKFTAEQHNAACSGCHAKMSPLTSSFTPGDRFFDHYDLTTLEDPDFYPDGRDLGENYTYNTWLMSPCVQAGKLNCVTCHTSSGRYRFKAPDKANDACAPCHEERVKNAAAHTRHKPESPASKCVACHMPMTSFARMQRTDHSMSPPAPAATIAYNSPNACNLCHTDKDAAWADSYVRQWRARDYQAPALKRANLIVAARKRDWRELPEMLAYIVSEKRDEIFATSLLRMIPASGDARMVPVLLKAAKDPSPLVRSAAVAAMQHAPTRETLKAIVMATGDEYRLVRVRAAASLAAFPDLPLDALEPADRTRVEAATKEYLASLAARPDQWSSHYNLGNYALNRKEQQQAIAAYDTALALEPRAVLAMVNQSMAYAGLGENKKADDALAKALTIAPDNAAANYNMGLLRAEQNDPKAAERYLKKALLADPQFAQAAYNLCVLISKDRVAESIEYCAKAALLRPQDPGYTYTLAFFQMKNGDENAAARTLETLIARQPSFPDSYLLLGGIYEKQGKKPDAEKIYTSALTTQGIPDEYKYKIMAKLKAIQR